MEKIICRCEEITEEEILEAIEMGFTTVEEIKRYTRAGMGHCQGRTCRALIAKIIAKKCNKPLEEVQRVTIRPPLKPTPLKVFADSLSELEEWREYEEDG